ncbi:MAG: 3-hydroxyacyl-CoA dehydrogenase family protein [Acidobacteria bacterium]|nr:3-hydroxyacyl-CoA dehydrogenase family protein [Acidobacteriota bacterium]
MSVPTGGNIEPVGLVGLGLMGRGIATCLLAYGLEVIGYNRTSRKARSGLRHIDESLAELARRKIVPRSQIRDGRGKFRLASSLEDLAPCRFVIESVKEDLPLKAQIFDRLEAALAPGAVIASNTSSLPITLLQTGRKHPERFVGMHWGEPAQLMRYLEIIPGEKTSKRTLKLTEALANRCGKDPTQLRRDIQGFISNRMMYAMLREACYLVEAGIADIETVDRSYRNDMGWWSTLAGPFRWMDLTGIPAYAAVMEGLLPRLCDTKSVPKLMRDMVASGGKGISSCRGFYKYTRAGARTWEKAWIDFTYDIRKLVEKYDKRVSPLPDGRGSESAPPSRARKQAVCGTAH